MKWKQQIYAMKPYQPGKPIEEVTKEFGLEEVVKLASNENPYGTSPKVTEFLRKNATNYAIYPDGYAQKLRTAVSEHLGINEKELIFGNGSDDLIAIITRALLYPGVNTVMANPSFSQYWHNAEIEGAEIRKVPTIDGRNDLQAMLAQIDENTSVVWVCSPNNPTGSIVTDEELRSFLSRVPKHVLIVLDEAYIEYIGNPSHENTLPYFKQYDNLILLRTFSKAYGLASFRVGYGIANENIIAKLDAIRGPFNNTVLSQEVAIVALQDQSFIDQCRIKNNNGKAQFIDFCERYNLHYYPTETNFILFDVKTDSDIIFQEMMKRGFIVRSGAALGVPGYIRVTIGTEEQNEKFLTLLEEVLQRQGVFV